MKLLDIKEWINSLPEEFLEYSVCSAEYGILTEDRTYRLDKPFISLDIDEENNEAIFIIETDKK